MMAQALGGVIMWIVFTGGGNPMDARPRAQYNDMATCLRAVNVYQSEVKSTIERLRDELNVGTTFLCLPIGVRP